MLTSDPVNQEVGPRADFEIFLSMKNYLTNTAHVLIHANAGKLTIHIYGIHNDITKTQPTKCNSNKYKLNLNDSHCNFGSKKSI